MNASAHLSVLVIDDEPQIRRLLRITLGASDFDVIEASSVGEGVRLCAARQPALVILDLGLEDGDGFEALVAIRAWSEVPIIVLTVRDAESEKIKLLEAGADDYVTKPFSTGELLARVKAALRKGARSPDAPTVYQNGPLRLNVGERTVTLNGTPVTLTRKEWALMAILARHAGRVVTHSQLLEDIWGPIHRDDVHYLRVLVKQLRAKLDDPADDPAYIRTEQGVGYRLISRSTGE